MLIQLLAAIWNHWLNWLNCFSSNRSVPFVYLFVSAHDSSTVNQAETWRNLEQGLTLNLVPVAVFLEAERSKARQRSRCQDVSKSVLARKIRLHAWLEILLFSCLTLAKFVSARRRIAASKYRKFKAKKFPAVRCHCRYFYSEVSAIPKPKPMSLFDET